MTIQSVFDPSFSKYGQVLTGYDLTGLLDTLERVTPVPEGTEYVPEQPELMALPVCGELSDRAYGGMPIQIGWCNGHNTKLNCLEYHRDSELNVGVQDFILLLAKREEMAIVLPKGTNLDKPAILAGNQEDQCLWARNKWLLAHKDSSEAAQGAPVRLDGENIDIAGLI